MSLLVIYLYHYVTFNVHTCVVHGNRKGTVTDRCRLARDVVWLNLVHTRTLFEFGTLSVDELPQFYLWDIKTRSGVLYFIDKTSYRIYFTTK